MSTSALFISNFTTYTLSIVNADANLERVSYKAGTSSSGKAHRVHAISCANNDSGTRTVKFYYGKVRTRQADGLTTITGTTTINRTGGSFITDGWTAGAYCLLVDPTTAGNYKAAQISSLTSTTLVFGAVWTNETLPSTAYLAHLTAIGGIDVATNAGHTHGTAAASFISASRNEAFDATPSRFVTVGPGDILAAAISGTVMAGSTRMDITTWGGDYT